MEISELDVRVQAALISAGTTLVIFFVGWIIKILYERYSLDHKLKKEYLFEQKKMIKREIAKTKVPLLNSAEEFNYRMWNFNKNIGENYHKINEENWFDSNQYYLNSFIYRFLVFMHYCIKTEEDILSMDSTVADKKDSLFLKYVKTFKNLFCDITLLKELGYDQNDDTCHFFRNELKGFCAWVLENGKVLDFDEFVSKLKHNYKPLHKVIEYFTRIENNETDKTLNVLWCAHLLSVSFLNNFGHSYQQNGKEKVKTLNEYYQDRLKVKGSFKEFLKSSKLYEEFSSDFKVALKK